MIEPVGRILSKQEFLDKFNRDTQARKKKKKQADKEYTEYHYKAVINQKEKGRK